MTERNSQRGRKPIMTDTKLVILRTSKNAKLVIGKDVITVPKTSNLLVARTL